MTITPAPEGHIEMHSGVFVDPMDLDPALVRIEDIAFALSNESRFTGHVRRCVADHCLVVRRIVELHGGSALAQLHALLHDAHEYVLRDLPGPLKHLPWMAPYCEACDRAQGVILGTLGIPGLRGKKDAVHEADLIALVLEAELRLPSRGRRYSCCTLEMLEAVAKVRHKVATMMLLPWEPIRAERCFLDEYWKLRRECGI